MTQCLVAIIYIIIARFNFNNFTITIKSTSPNQFLYRNVTVNPTDKKSIALTNPKEQRTWLCEHTSETIVRLNIYHFQKLNKF